MNVLSLFDGISCGHLALDRVGIKVDNYFASEVDKHALQVTMTNYPNTIQLGDVRSIDFHKYKNIDLLLGGSPCQDLSKASTKQAGLNGEKSKLFFNFIDALKIAKPKYYIFENVGGMSNLNKSIINAYFGHGPISINSNLVSAQYRHRYYWTNINNIPMLIDKNIFVKDIIEEQVLPKYYIQKDYKYIRKNIKRGAIRSGLEFVCGIDGTGNKDASYNFSQGSRVYSINGKSCTINAGGGGVGAKTGLYYLEDGKEFSRNNIRKLTPLETERLQTIPDNYTAGLSDANRYKCVGNGWTVDVIAHILKGLYIVNKHFE